MKRGQLQQRQLDLRRLPQRLQQFLHLDQRRLQQFLLLDQRRLALQQRLLVEMRLKELLRRLALEQRQRLPPSSCQDYPSSLP